MYPACAKTQDYWITPKNSLTNLVGIDSVHLYRKNTTSADLTCPLIQKVGAPCRVAWATEHKNMLPIAMFVGDEAKVYEFMGSDITSGFDFFPKVQLQEVHLEHFGMVNFRSV